MSTDKIWVVIPNWNGVKLLPNCIGSLENQSLKPEIIVVDNGSKDDSIAYLENNHPNVKLIRHSKNLGFTGGVNAGIKYAMNREAEYIALFNSDAIADKYWLENLINAMKERSIVGIANGKIIKTDTKMIDNTGEEFSTWGLPFARNRDKNPDECNEGEYIFGSSGGSTLYRVKMLKEVGIFDNDFFAYYEDADMNLRALLRGWRAWYEPKAIVTHEVGSTSSRIGGFTTYQTIKNLPWVITKDIPSDMLLKVLPRFLLIYHLIFFKALLSRNFFRVIKGYVVSLVYIPKKLNERKAIQKNRKISSQELRGLMHEGLPPDSSLNRIFAFFK